MTQQHAPRPSATTERAAPQSEFQELLYKGSTRVVVGPGFEAQQLLFNEKTSSTQSFAVTTGSRTVDGQDAQSPLVAPGVLTRKTRTGTVSLTWTSSVATGAARLILATAGTANAFFQSFLAKQCHLSRECPVELVGFISEEHRVIVKGPHNRRSMLWQKSMPPLTPVQLDEGETVFFFDEDKIATMEDRDVACFSYVAAIRGGLRRTINEDQLKQLVHPHQCVVAIDRRADHSARRVDPAHCLSLLLRANLTHGDMVARSQDPFTMRAGAHVACSDWARLEEVETRSVQCLSGPHGQAKKMPSGHSISTTITYEFRGSLSHPTYKCFRDNYAKARLYARIHGVEWFEEGALYTTNPAVAWYEEGTQSNKDHKPYVVIQLRSTSRDALERLQRVEAALHASIDSEPFVDLVLQETFKSETEWRGLVEELSTASQQSTEMEECSVFEDRVIWVYGPKSTRREKLRRMVTKSLSSIHELRSKRGDKLVCSVCTTKATNPSIQLQWCGHTCCVNCLEPGVAPTIPLPFFCPAENCDFKIQVTDILKVTKDVDALVATAVRGNATSAVAASDGATCAAVAVYD